MHLLVLSAFRRKTLAVAQADLTKSQCTFWCSVLSDLKLIFGRPLSILMSQCTFWCSVLSDDRLVAAGKPREQGLNAPFGAQCFPTSKSPSLPKKNRQRLNAPFGAQCFPTESAAHVALDNPSQCTFWCSVLSDITKEGEGFRVRVSMHLLVLSAFRRGYQTTTRGRKASLNAPFGAQCFPTGTSDTTDSG